jgi:hydrogenase maturation protein HypF
MELEAAIDAHATGAYTLPLVAHDNGFVWDVRPLLRAVIADALASTPAGCIAARFHRALVRAIADGCVAARATHGVATVVLSGGCFQNATLLRWSRAALTRAKFRVLSHRRVPPNDGGLSLGQAAVAAATLES